MTDTALLGPFEAGTWYGRPAVFKAPNVTPIEGGGTRIGIGFPVLIVSDAVMNPEFIAAWAVEALNAHDVAVAAKAAAEKPLPLDDAPRDGTEIIGILDDGSECGMVWWVKWECWLKTLGVSKVGEPVDPVAWRAMS